VIGPDAKWRSGHQGTDVLQQQLVLEDAAGKNDRVDAIRLAHRLCGITQAAADTSLKGAGDLGRISPARPIVNH